MDQQDQLELQGPRVHKGLDLQDQRDQMVQPDPQAHLLDQRGQQDSKAKRVSQALPATQVLQVILVILV